MVLAVLVIVMVKCRSIQVGREDTRNCKSDLTSVPPVPLPRPPDVLQPTSPHPKRFTSNGSSPTPGNTPLPAPASVLQCKVIPLEPVDSVASSEPDLNARYPYGVSDEPTEDWSSYDTSELGYQPRTGNPMLRRNQYWVWDRAVEQFHTARPMNLYIIRAVHDPHMWNLEVTIMAYWTDQWWILLRTNKHTDLLWLCVILADGSKWLMNLQQWVKIFHSVLVWLLDSFNKLHRLYNIKWQWLWIMNVEVVVTNLKVLWQHFPRGTEESNKKTLVRITDLQIWKPRSPKY